jgi:hypothetical protein
MVKHGRALGLKKAKKEIINAMNEAHHNKMKHVDNYLFSKKEDVQKSEEQIQKEVADLNKNVPKNTLTIAHETLHGREPIAT